MACVVLFSGAAACTPEIGDACNLSTDCSVRGERACDTSQPGGYCTVLNCGGNGCPDENSCVLFGAALPGCAYSDRSGPYGSRASRSFCMATCTSNDDCRPGYVCGDPRTPPWNALILDDDQAKRSCLALASEDLGSTAHPTDAPVCGPLAPPVPPIDAGAPRVYDAGAEPLFPEPPPADASADGG